MTLNKKTLFVIVIFAVGLLLRIIFPKNFGIGFDQIQIISHTRDIISGDLTLIGPRTGPANMFTGPLIYYLSVPFVMIVGDYLTVALVPVLISAITGLTIYYLMHYYYGVKEGLIALSIWALSPFLVTLDRTFWNPNLTLLATSLVFIPITKQKPDKLSLCFITLGSFLAYQAHFSGLILVFLGLSTAIIRKSFQKTLAIITGFTLSILPTIIFDIRNNFLNTKGLLSLLQKQGEFNLLSLSQDFVHNLYIIAETQGKLFFYGNSTELAVTLGLVSIATAIILVKKHKYLRLPLLWIITTALFYSFYSGQKPEYYFLIIIPPLLMVSTQIVKMAGRNLQQYLLAVFVLSASLFNINQFKEKEGLTIRNISYIQEQLSQKNVSEIIYDMPYGTEVGVKYFLDQIELDNNGEVYHISYPNDLSFRNVHASTNLAYWQDKRQDNKNYITHRDYILETAEDVYLYQDLYHKQNEQSLDVYKVVTDGLVVANLSLADNNLDKSEWGQTCLQQKEIKKGLAQLTGI